MGRRGKKRKLFGFKKKPGETDRILFRKLSKKARFEFGEYLGMSVDYVLESQYRSEEKKMALVRYYYMKKNISFTDDVLEELGIRPEDRIIKPGINQLLCMKYEKYYLDQMTEAEKEEWERKRLEKLRKKQLLRRYERF